jgi:hypothetical protein
MPIVFDQFLPKWNYKAVPIFWNRKVINFLFRFTWWSWNWG